MNKKNEYQPLDAMEYPRFEGIRTFMRLPHVSDLNNIDIAIVGVPFDTGATFRVGARFGPSGIRDNSLLLRPYNPAQKIEIFEHCSAVDHGDLPIVPGYLKESHLMIKDGAQKIFDEETIPIFIGGDHSISLPLLRAAKEKYGPIALVHFDAHSDLWHGYFDQKDTHGTPFRRALEEGLIAERSDTRDALFYAISRREELSKAMQHLTDDQRQVLAYRFALGMSHAEISRLMNRNEPAVRALQFRAIATLRTVLREDSA